MGLLHQLAVQQLTGRCCTDRMQTVVLVQSCKATIAPQVPGICWNHWYVRLCVVMLACVCRFIRTPGCCILYRYVRLVVREGTRKTPSTKLSTLLSSAHVAVVHTVLLQPAVALCFIKAVYRCCISLLCLNESLICRG